MTKQQINTLLMQLRGETGKDYCNKIGDAYPLLLELPEPQLYYSSVRKVWACGFKPASAEAYYSVEASLLPEAVSRATAMAACLGK